MILTVTLNPSVDISYEIPNFQLDDANRTNEVRKTAGGKGLNVTRVSHLLGAEVKATGILGGTIGQFIEKKLDDDSIKHDFYKIDQESRNCIAILHDGKQTEVMEPGPTLSSEEAELFETHYLRLLNQGVQVLTLSGSLPKGIQTDYYVKLIAHANELGIPVVLDTSGVALHSVLSSNTARPTLIKPNLAELEQLLGESVTANVEVLKNVLLNPLFRDIATIVVTLGKDGAFVKHEGDYYSVSIPEVKAVNPVGSGDATVAGMAKALGEELSIDAIVKHGMAAGILNALEKQTGYVQASNFDHYYHMITVNKL
ncbi:hexose kinase [Paucisalibacillus globulus]|uniref:hexose kinase n=1 Tax=Paucisalibacillus globulus TaxID=351095 RepID=UPI00040B5511|nr:hexose kinase [Paucisalibacillus globulus]